MHTYLAILRTAAIVLFTAIGGQQAIAVDKDPLRSPGLAQDVISSIESPMQYNWRESAFELTFGYGYFDEANNFENEAFELTVGFPQNSGQIFRLNLRRVVVMQTASSKQLGRTPFKQEADATRYEIGIGFLYGLMEGRQITRLSPWIPDLETSLLAVFGGHFAHASADIMPKRSQVVEPILGRDTINHRYGLEFGLEWQVYLPDSLGLRTSWVLHRSLPGGDDLKWSPLFMTGIVWGVH